MINKAEILKLVDMPLLDARKIIEDMTYLKSADFALEIYDFLKEEGHADFLTAIVDSYN